MNWKILAGIGVVVLLGYIWPRHEEPMKPADEAVYACRSFVKKQLNDPNSAQFVNGTATLLGDTWTVNIQLRAKNAFNALILGSYSCALKSEPDQWRAISIRQTSP